MKCPYCGREKVGWLIYGRQRNMCVDCAHILYHLDTISYTDRALRRMLAAQPRLKDLVLSEIEQDKDDAEAHARLHPSPPQPQAQG